MDEARIDKDPLYNTEANLSFMFFINLLVSLASQMNAKVRPSFAQIVAQLERRQAERKQKDEATVKGESSNTLLAPNGQHVCSHSVILSIILSSLSSFSSH